jgi:LmbE family N-acetylglucosaminyl deacetylase
VILSINHHDSWGGPSWNHADHRAVGRSLLDAVRDAANPWVFPDAGPAWGGVRAAAFNASPFSTHAVDVTGHLDRGIESLRCHELYLANLGGDPETAGDLVRQSAESTGARLGVTHAVAFELITF